MKAGYAYCEATEAFQVSYEIPPAKLDARACTATSAATRALALGFVAASQKAGLPLFLGTLSRSRPPPTSCTSCRCTRSSAS